MRRRYSPRPFDRPVPKEVGRPSWPFGPVVEDGWDEAENRLLLVLDWAPSSWLEAGRTLVREGPCLPVLDRAFRLAGTSGDGWKTCWAPFWWFRTVGLSSEPAEIARAAADGRIKEFIRETGPTHVHFFGDCDPFGQAPTAKVRRVDGVPVSSNVSITAPSTSYDETGQTGPANLMGHAADNLARLIRGSYPCSLAGLAPNPVMVDTKKAFSDLAKRMDAARFFGLDLETFNLTATANGIVTMQVAFDESEAFVLPLRHKDSPWDAETFRRIMARLRRIFGRKFDPTDVRVPFLVGQNLAFDLMVLRTELALPIIHMRAWDCMAGEYALDENLKALPRPYSLDAIFERYENDFYAKADFGKADRKTISDVSLDREVLEYCAMDAQAVVGIARMQRKRARGIFPKGVYEKLVLGVLSDTTHVISHMRQTGVKTDPEWIERQFDEATSDVDREKRRLTEELLAMPSVRETDAALLRQEGLPSVGLFGSDGMTMFDVSTRAHKQALFFETLGLEPTSMTSTGDPTLGKEFYARYAKDVPEASLLKAIEESKKALGYVKNYHAKLSETDGRADDRIRPGYGFVMVYTGRSNSFGPNLQQVPAHGSYAKIVKRCFVSPEGRILVKMDYSTHEVRCWCLVSGDKALAGVFREVDEARRRFRDDPTDANREAMGRMDLHRLNYSSWSGVDVNDVTNDMRQASKGLTFGVIYGMSVNSVARQLGKTKEETQGIYDGFFGKFETAGQWLKDTVKKARRDLWIENPIGFRRNLSGYLTGEDATMAAMDRRAQNSPVQGFASQIGFMAARLLLHGLHDAFPAPDPEWKDGRFVAEPPPFNLNAMIHDSIEVESSYEALPTVLAQMEACGTEGVMAYVSKVWDVEWTCPVAVDFEIGDSGDAMKGWDMTREGLKEAVVAAAKNHRARGLEIARADVKAALREIDG